MSDDTVSSAASFFKKKSGKDKKKKFKSFNANMIDTSTVDNRTHVDDDSQKAGLTKAGKEEGEDEWTESKAQKAVMLTSSTAKLVDFNAVSLGQKTEEEDISERVRIEETRRQLQEVRMKAAADPAAATAKAATAAAASAAPAAPAAPAADTGGPKKWVPSSRANRGPAMMSEEAPRFGASRGGSGGSSLSSGNSAAATGGFRKVDTTDAAAFPTLGGKAPVAVASGAWGAVAAEKEEEPAPPAAAEGAEESIFKMAGGGGDGEEEGEKVEKKKKKKKNLADFI